MQYDRKDIRAGLFMTKNGGPVFETPIRPRAPRYGDPPPPDFSEASAKLDQVKVRIEKLRADLRAARQRK